MSYKYRKWTDEEAAILRRFGPAGWAKVSMRLKEAGFSRTRLSIQTKAKMMQVELGTNIPSRDRRGMRWLEAEDEILARTAGRGVAATRNALAAAGYGRTMAAIKTRGQVLGVPFLSKTSASWSQDEMEVVMEHAIQGPDVVIKELALAGYTRSLSGVQALMCRLHLVDRTCSGCGKEYAVSQGRSKCPECGGVPDPDVAQQPVRTAARLAGAGSFTLHKTQVHYARTQVSTLDPWHSAGFRSGVPGVSVYSPQFDPMSRGMVGGVEFAPEGV